MSPASSGGNLEVGKYIGACLISRNRYGKISSSSQQQGISLPEVFYHHHNNARETLGTNNRHHQAEVYSPPPPGNYGNFNSRYCCGHNQSSTNGNMSPVASSDGWAGGMPLISFANHQRRNNGIINNSNNCSTNRQNHHQEVRKCWSSPLTRLAVHTQGAPLIVTKTTAYHNNNNKKHRAPSCGGKVSVGSLNHVAAVPINPSDCSTHASVPASPGVGGIDAVSVTSDEGSGGSSTNLENVLPRIIKPRKRRKKDRKPGPTLLGRPLVGGHHHQDEGFSSGSSSTTSSPDIISPQDSTSLSNVQNPAFGFPFVFSSPTSSYLHQRRQINSLAQDPSSEAPQLHHKFEDVEDLEDSVDFNGNQSTTTCQCRYCDPSGQIWDVDRNCYSPFLTAPTTKSSSSFLDHRPLISTPISYNAGVNNHNNINNNDNNNNNNNFEISYCLTHSMSSVSLEDDKSPETKVAPRSPKSCGGDLEVSTEIVTSLNGHRDLEIKFFSSTPSAVSTDSNNSDVIMPRGENNRFSSDPKFSAKFFSDFHHNDECSISRFVAEE